MIITIGTTSLEVKLYDNRAARSLQEILPQEIRMNSWGNEYYGELAKRINYEGDELCNVFDIGEVALWPSGNALCIFFGSTPASINGEPRMASDGVALGRITSDISVLKKLKGSLSHVKISAKP